MFYSSGLNSSPKTSADFGGSFGADCAIGRKPVTASHSEAIKLLQNSNLEHLKRAFS
jgi:hypothetical protein